MLEVVLPVHSKNSIGPPVVALATYIPFFCRGEPLPPPAAFRLRQVHKRAFVDLEALNFLTSVSGRR